MIYFTFADSFNHNVKTGKTDIMLKKSIIKKLCRLLFKPIIANPDFEDKFNQVSRWYIEYDDIEGYTTREIGIDNKGHTIVKAPYKKNIGFWCDEDLPYEQYKEFGIKEVTAEQFNEKWYRL